MNLNVTTLNYYLLYSQFYSRRFFYSKFMKKELMKKKLSTFDLNFN